MSEMRERVERVAKDIEKVARGDFDISHETRRDLAEAIRDRMEGRQSYEYKYNDRVTVEGYRKNDGEIGINFKVSF